MYGRGYGTGSIPGNGAGDPMFDRERQNQFQGNSGFGSEPGNHWSGFGGQREFHRGGMRHGICNGWRQTGKCAYGDRCRFYHEQRGESQPPQHTNAGQEVPGTATMNMRHDTDRERNFSGAGGRFGEGGRPPWDRERPPIRDGPHFKTKLCEKFQQLGHCPYEDRCTFAHGHQELRPFPRQHFDGPPGIPGHGMGADAYKAHTNQITSSRGGVHAASHNPRGSPRNLAAANSQSVPKVVDITYLDRVRGICHVLAIGEAAYVEQKPGAVQAALTSIKNGAAFRDNLYADSVEGYIPQ